MIFFTSDHHFGHANVIQYTRRPYSHITEMDDDLIRRWNERVGAKDMVYHLGDFTLGNPEQAQRYFSQLNGNIQVLWNPWHHDKRWLPVKTGETRYISKTKHKVNVVSPIVVLELKQYRMGGYPQILVLCHYPMAKWDRSHYGSWHLHGHSHGTYIADGLLMDVGVDTPGLGYAPISLEDVAKNIAKPKYQISY